MIVRQLLKRCGTSTTRRWLSEGKRSSSGYVQVAQDNLIDNPNIIRSHMPDINIPNITIPEVIWQNLEKWPEKTAITCTTTGRSYTFVELRRRSNNFARALRSALKLPRGSCIAVLLPNVPEYPIALLGALEAGIIITTVNPIYTADEISRQLIDSGARAIVTLVELFPTATAATKSSIPIITVKTTQDQGTPNGAINFTELTENKIENVHDIGWGSPDDIAILPYSSGTTGLPKGVELTHRNIVANLLQVKSFDTLLTEQIDFQETVSCVLPMFHIYGLSSNLLKTLSTGARLATLSRFTPDTFINLMKNYRPEHMFVVPPIVIFLAAHPEVTSELLKPVRSIITGAAPVGSSDVERLFHKANREIVTLQGYGMTETSPAICLTFPEMWKECMGSIGMCINNTELKVVSIEDGVTPLGPNEKGELLVKGPQVMNGYYNNPKATEDVFTSDGFLKTGDMVYYDDNKIFWISDRLKELIKVKGFQVAPAELEALIRNHPSVGDAAVIGIPHPLYGEVPKAFIVPKPGSEIKTDEISEYVASNVASYKKLEGGVTVLNSIPKTASGKILRRTLKDMHEAENK